MGFGRITDGVTTVMGDKGRWRRLTGGEKLGEDSMAKIDKIGEVNMGEGS